MSSEIVVISLDDLDKDKNPAYWNTPVKGKIEILKYCIENAYSQLREQHPHALIIVTWQEYGLTNSDGPAYCLNKEEKDYFNQEMKKVTRNIEGLMVIAGTIVYGKKYTMQQHNEAAQKKIDTMLQKIHANYKNLIADQQINRRSLLNEFSIFKNARQKEQFIKLRNTCRVYMNGEEIYVHHKIIPSEETKLNKQYKIGNLLFSPGTKPGIFSVFHNGKTYNIGIEICSERGILRKILSEQPQLLGEKKKLDIQMLISASKNFNEKDYFCYDFLHIDSKFRRIHKQIESNQNVTFCNASIKQPESDIFRSGMIYSRSESNQSIPQKQFTAMIQGLNNTAKVLEDEGIEITMETLDEYVEISKLAIDQAFDSKELQTETTSKKLGLG